MTSLETVCAAPPHPWTASVAEDVPWKPRKCSAFSSAAFSATAPVPNGCAAAEAVFSAPRRALVARGADMSVAKAAAAAARHGQTAFPVEVAAVAAAAEIVAARLGLLESALATAV